jgi:predicted RNA-binding Zn-ribbon protein involved in translation (DUF1610 family)
MAMPDMLRTAVGVEVKVKCNACGNPVPVNALVAQVLCPKCERMCPIIPGEWTGLLNTALNVIPHLEPGDERRTPKLGSGPTVLAVRENPRCQGCKAELPAETFGAMVERGFGLCPACGKRMSCRRAGADVAPTVPARAILLGEDEDQLAGPPGNLDARQAVKPINFPCPSCGATLPVDGLSRVVTCRFCSNDSFLPDALWQTFHPVRVSDRWYISYSLGERPFEWTQLREMVVDAQGNLYCIGTLAWELRDFHVFSLGSGLELRWVRRDFVLDGGTRLAIGPDGRLFLGDPGKHPLLVLSCADGATVGQVGGAAQSGSPGGLDYADAKTFAVDTDGTILVLAGKSLRRFTPDGREIEPWPGVPPERRSPEVRSVGELFPQPVHFDAEYCDQIAIGWDGFIYLTRDEKVTKLDHGGKIVHQTAVRMMSVQRRWGAAANGWLYVFGDARDPRVAWPSDSETVPTVMVVSPDGREQRRCLLDQASGGPLGSEDHLAVTPEGVVWLLGYNGLARRIGPDGTPQLVSGPSRERDEQERRKRRPAAGW